MEKNFWTMQLNEQIEFRKLLSAAFEKFSMEGSDPNAVMGIVVAMESWVDQHTEKAVNAAVKQIVFKRDKRIN